MPSATRRGTFSQLVRRSSGRTRGLGHGRHEVRVARPPRQHVHVHVPGDAGAGRAPEVQADVDAVGRVGGLERAHGVLRHRHDRRGLVGLEVLELGLVAQRSDHQMARRVRIRVHDREDELVARDDERLVVRRARQRAEQAVVRSPSTGSRPRRPRRQPASPPTGVRASPPLRDLGREALERSRRPGPRARAARSPAGSRRRCRRRRPRRRPRARTAPSAAWPAGSATPVSRCSRRPARRGTLHCGAGRQCGTRTRRAGRRPGAPWPAPARARAGRRPRSARPGWRRSARSTRRAPGGS